MNGLVNEDDISGRESEIFYKSVREFHCAAFTYATNNFLLHDEFLQVKQFMNCCDRNCTFQSVLFIDVNLKSYINFSDQDLCRLEEEFLSLQSMTLDDIMKKAFKEAVIRHGDEEHAVVYRIDVLCYHLLLQNITSTSRSNFLSLVQPRENGVMHQSQQPWRRVSFSICQEIFDPAACVFRIRWNSFKYSNPPPTSCRELLLIPTITRYPRKSHENTTRNILAQTWVLTKIVTCSRVSKVS